jgi:hypothetical protein
MTEFKGYTLTSKESEALEALLKEMRAEEARQRAIQEQEMQIEAAIDISISVIGLEETKRIVRKASKDLRSKTDDPCDNCEQCIEMRNGIHAKCPKTGLFDECEKYPKTDLSDEWEKYPF